MHGLLSCLVTALATSLVTAGTRVVVVGGTHGNEYTGVYLVERLQAQHSLLRKEYPSLTIDTLIANPRAYANNQRFVEDDLNRKFTDDQLKSRQVDQQCYESQRALEIEADLGPKGPGASAEFVIDMHTTTANMGCTIIVNSYCALALRAAAYVSECWAADTEEGPGPAHPLRIYLHEVTQSAAPYLCSVARAGITIEVGPTPQGLLRADCVASTDRALRLLLEYLELHYSGGAPRPPPKLRVFVDQGKMPWPDAGGESSLPGALIVPTLQDRDFEVLRAGDPMFENEDGTVVLYDGSCGESVYPVFVNEAAYYYAQSGRGVGLTRVADWPVV